MHLPTLQSGQIVFASQGSFLQVFKAFLTRLRKRRNAARTQDDCAYANSAEALYVNVIECPGRPYLIGAGTYLVARMLMSDRLHQKN